MVTVALLLGVLVAGCALIAVLVDAQVWPLVAMSVLLTIAWRGTGASLAVAARRGFSREPRAARRSQSSSGA